MPYLIMPSIIRNVLKQGCFVALFSHQMQLQERHLEWMECEWLEKVLSKNNA